MILAGRMSKILKDKIRPGITLTGQAEQSSGNAIYAKDDVHLILEYKRNEEWGKYKSPRANRYSKTQTSSTKPLIQNYHRLYHIK